MVEQFFCFVFKCPGKPAVLVVEYPLVFQYVFTHLNSSLTIACGKMGSFDIKLEDKYQCYFNRFAILQSKETWSVFTPNRCGSILVNLEPSEF